MTIITAHSGADGLPDNSLSFIRHAIDSGADVFEADVRRSADGTLRLGHDAADVSAPALMEAFTLLAGTERMRMNCDLKEPGLMEPVSVLAREAGVEGRLILTGTADACLYAASPEIQKTAELWVNIEEYVPGIYDHKREPTDAEARKYADTILSFCSRCRLTTVNMHYLFAVPELSKRLSSEGVGLSVWTVNEEDLIIRFLSDHVYAMTTRNLSFALSERNRIQG